MVEHEEPSGASRRIARLAALLSDAEALGADDRAEALATIDALFTELGARFAKEEESLFAFVIARFPAMEKSVARLAWLHDALVGTLVRLRAALVSADLRIGARHSRFVLAHAEHETHERALVASLRRRLDPDERVALAQLVDLR